MARTSLAAALVCATPVLLDAAPAEAEEPGSALLRAQQPQVEASGFHVGWGAPERALDADPDGVRAARLYPFDTARTFRFATGSAPSARPFGAPRSGSRAAPPDADADAPSDPFWGPDKAQHFGIGFALGALGYGLGRLALDDAAAAAGLSGGLVLGLGALKEGLDAAGLGTPSWKDFLWTALGGSLGLALAGSFDAAF